jgi:predicted SnoaL-like aldol condensation-catalyzing enzyme
MESKNNMEIAVDFLNLSSMGQSREAFGKYVATDFKHHNVYYKGDAESLILAMEENAGKTPDKIFEIKHSIQDGSMVVVHSHVRKNSEDPGTAVVHIFRFNFGKIAELWDLGQPVPQNTINENGMF